MEEIPKENHSMFLVKFDPGPYVSFSPLYPQCLSQYPAHLHSVIMCLIVNMDGNKFMRTKGGVAMFLLRNSDITHTTDNLHMWSIILKERIDFWERKI